MGQCWDSVVDGGPTLTHHWGNVSSLLGTVPSQRLIQSPTPEVSLHPLIVYSHYIRIISMQCVKLRFGYMNMGKPRNHRTKIKFCETQWPWPPLFTPSWLIQWSMGEGVLYNLCFHRVTSLRFTEWSMGEGVLYNFVFTEWRHCVSQNCDPTLRRFVEWWWVIGNYLNRS